MTLEVDNIELNYFGYKVLYGIYIKAQKGKITGILGRNGCGKTSLLRIIYGDLKPKYKTIRINGKHESKALFKTNKISYLPQHKLYPDSLKLSTVFKWHNVQWSLFIKDFIGFEKYKYSKFNEVSSGERRIIEIYLMLLSKKGILLLDEPFSFISPLYIHTFKKIINTIKKHKTIIITDHFYKEVLAISDKVYLIKNGSSKIISSSLELEIEGYSTKK